MPVARERLKLRVFISSVQKELASERLAFQVLLTTDPFLQQHTVPILFEREVHGLRPDPQEYLRKLDACQLYVVILKKTYGAKFGDLSATHHEYRRAQELRLPTLPCVFGERGLEREEEVDSFIAEVQQDNHTYSRFHTLKELQQIVRDRLIEHIRSQFHIEPTLDEDSQGQSSIQVASAFERQRLSDVPYSSLVADLGRELAVAAEEADPHAFDQDQVAASLRNRGYLWHEADEDKLCATAAGLLLAGRDPTEKFAHCRVQADAFSGSVRDSRAADHATISGSIPEVIDRTVAFIHRNIRHPLRVRGLTRVEVAEYPEEAIREALVNALAHRDYDDPSRHVIVEVFPDRLVFSSPGGPPGDQSLAQIKAGRSRPRSRNPLVSQGLRFLDKMDERGTGILRMQAAMLDHGLDKPRIEVEDDYFIVTLPGAGSDIERIRIPVTEGSGLPPSVEELLTDRQKGVLRQAVEAGQVTTGWCVKTYGISRDTAVRDLKQLVALQLLHKSGVGRSMKYLPGGGSE